MSTREAPTHSPAPWTYDPDTDETTDAEGNLVTGTIYAIEDFPCLDEDEGPLDGIQAQLEANRRLITKAPELLAACRDFVRGYERVVALLEQPLESPWFDRMKALVDHVDGTGET